MIRSIQIGGSGENVRHSTDGESHTLSKEIGEIDDIGDCEISARPAGDADAFIEIENVLEKMLGEGEGMKSDKKETDFAPTEEVKLSSEGRGILQLSDDGSNFSGVGCLGGDSEGGAQEEGR